MEKKALFFDIDGTILSEITKEIPRSTLEALQRAKEMGHALFINTGRTSCSVPAELRRLPFDGFLCGCGIYLEYGGEVVFERHFPKVRRDEVVKKAESCFIDVICEGAEDVYFPARISRFDSLENTRRYMNNRGLGLERYLEQGDCPYDKVFAYTDGFSKKEEFFSFIAPELEVVDRGQGTYECVLAGYSKATAIRYMLDILGMDLEQAYVFGDSSNDLPMFEYAKHTVAMGKHDQVLEPYTEFITTTVEDDGIWYAMRHFGLM